MVIKCNGKSPFIILPFIYIYNWKWWFSSAQTVYQRLTSPCWSWAAVAPPPRTSAPSKARPVWRPSRPWRGACPSAPGHVPGAGTPPMRGGFGKIIQKLGDAGMLHYHVWWPEGVWWGNKGVLKQGIPKIQSFHRQKPWLDDKNPTIFRYTQVSFFFGRSCSINPYFLKMFSVTFFLSNLPMVNLAGPAFCLSFWWSVLAFFCTTWGRWDVTPRWDTLAGNTSNSLAVSFWVVYIYYNYTLYIYIYYIYMAYIHLYIYMHISHTMHYGIYTKQR